MSAVRRCTLPSAVSASSGGRVGSSDVVSRRVLRKRRRSPWRSSGYATNDARARHLGTGYDARRQICQRLPLRRQNEDRAPGNLLTEPVATCFTGKSLDWHELMRSRSGRCVSCVGYVSIGPKRQCQAVRCIIDSPIGTTGVAADPDTVETVVRLVPPVA